MAIILTASVLAINPDTGALKWYFQFTPHDLYDYDANETPVLVDVEEGGATRHLLVQANRNGFLYVLDRTNGKFISAAPFVEKLNWAKGVDASGRPQLSGRIPTSQGTYICPGINGATNWFAPSYNPDTGFFYVIALRAAICSSPTQSRSQRGRLTTTPVRNFLPMNVLRRCCWRTLCEMGR